MFTGVNSPVHQRGADTRVCRAETRLGAFRTRSETSRRGILMNSITAGGVGDAPWEKRRDESRARKARRGRHVSAPHRGFSHRKETTEYESAGKVEVWGFECGQGLVTRAYTQMRRHPEL